ncbi:isochorismatase family protein [Allorhodopirellula heiligendammensis]|nr:isochorismatase family protein [Allorhodopirellula heiligendammensis]
MNTQRIAILLSVSFAIMANSMLAANDLTLNLRSRATAGSDPSVRRVTWEPSRTAMIICDMWDDHWCKSAASRVNEMAPALNDAVNAARRQGVFIIHAPSSVVSFYADSAQRKLAQTAPFAQPPIELATASRWGTAWCWTDADHEGVLPIDDSDMGCSCEAKKCEIREAWSRQNELIQIADGDAITDNAQEAFNLLAERNIDNVILCGVHLNMCVLGRPVGIRQMVKLGKHVALMRDLTDTMYNPERPPGVDHFTGTDLVIDHVEKFWCPSFVSTDITGTPAFVFAEDTRPGDSQRH